MLTERALTDITGEIVDAAVKLHIGLGPGLLESIYEAVLARDLARRGLRVERQKSVSFEYDGLQFNDALRADLVVESRVVIEIKSVEKVLAVHPKQLLTYLRLLKLPCGLLLNFGAATMKDGIHRIMNGYSHSSYPPLH
jgi:iron complex transport system substrate-binding protein